MLLMPQTKILFVFNQHLSTEKSNSSLTPFPNQQLLALQRNKVDQRNCNVCFDRLKKDLTSAS